MKAKLLIPGIMAALAIFGLTSCGSVSGPSYYVPANNGKGGVQAVR